MPCDFCYDRPMLQVTGINGRLKSVACPKCQPRPTNLCPVCSNTRWWWQPNEWICGFCQPADLPQQISPTVK